MPRAICMITSARIGADLKPAGVDWITCLRAPAIQALAEENGPLQLSLFDQRDLAEISAPEMFPGERLIAIARRPLGLAEPGIVAAVQARRVVLHIDK